jgi:hypothetical protein
MTKLTFALIASVALLGTPALADDAAPKSPRTVEKTVTTDKGTTTVSKVWDPAAGNHTVDRTTTTTDGKTATSSYERQKTDTGFEASGERTGFNGKTSSFDSSLVKNGDGTADYQYDRIGQNGQTLAVDHKYTKTETGVTGAGTWSTSGGKSGTTATDFEKLPDGHSRSTAITNSDGSNVYKRDALVKRSATGVSRTINRDGRAPRALRSLGRRPR